MLTGTGVETWEGDEFASHAILQSFQGDLVLLQQSRRVAVSVLHDFVFSCLDDFARSRRDLVK